MRVLLKLSGESLGGPAGKGIDEKSLVRYAREIVDAVKAGPLPADVLEAFEQAWIITKPDSPEYFTLYRGKGSVGGETK